MQVSLVIHLSDVLCDFSSMKRRVHWVCDTDEEKNVALFGPQTLILIYNDKPFRLAMQIGSDKQFHS